MTRHPRPAPALALLLTTLAALWLAGCSSSSTGPDDAGDDYDERTSPANTIARLSGAYRQMDADVYIDCLSDTFTFRLENTDTPTLPDSWDLDTEVDIHSVGFASRIHADSISLTMTQYADPVQLSGQQPGDVPRWQHYESYDIRMYRDDATYWGTGYATLVIAVDPDTVSAAGDTLWEVVRWTDTETAPCRGREVTNWTDIKILLGQSESYAWRTSPANVIDKLTASYEGMDPYGFCDCLADTFSFWLNEDDIMNDPTLPEYWGAGTERTIAFNMLGPGTNVEDIELTLTQFGDPVEIPSAVPGAPSMWQVDYTVDLMVYLPNDFALLAYGVSRFIFAVDPDMTGPTGETLWHIAEWHDLDAWRLRHGGDLVAATGADHARPGGERVEETSWGNIKAMYR